MDVINLRRVAWDKESTEEKPASMDTGIVEMLTEKILQRLEKQLTTEGNGIP